RHEDKSITRGCASMLKTPASGLHAHSDSRKAFLGLGLCMAMAAPLLSAACGGNEQVAPPPLSYERNVYMPGLHEVVRIIKSPHRRVVVRADGSQQGVSQTWNENRRAHRARFGPFVRGFYEHLMALPEGAPVSAS